MMSRTKPLQLVILGNSGSRRVADFLAAAARLRWPAPRLLDYVDLLDGRARLEAALRTGVSGCVLRIESPGESWEVERRLLRLGIDALAAEGGVPVTEKRLATMPFERGAIVRPRQWYLGLVGLLAEVQRCLEALPDVRLMAHPGDIPILFDKTRCQRRFAAAGTPVPRFWPSPGSYDELRERFRSCRQRRLFVKLAHGSAAVGAIALEWQGPRVRALTTVEMASRAAGSGPRLFASKRVRSLTSEADVAALVDALAPEKLHVEEWLAKASLGTRRFDMRVLTIAGRACHVVGRLSATPFTNLDLGNARVDGAAVRERLGEHWRVALRLCEDAAAVFPRSFYLGIDLLVRPGCDRFAVLEANAFGDHLRRVEFAGRDAYEAELLALAKQHCQEGTAPCAI